MIMGKSKHDLHEQRAKSMRSQTRNRNGWLIRLVAGPMLAVMLPASVFAAPLRYCVGQNGHHGIEFVHAKDFSRSSPSVTGVSSARLIDLSLEAAHAIGSHCEDRVLLPQAAKLKVARIVAPNPERDLGTLFRLRLSFDQKNRVKHAAGPSATRSLQSDPRLVSIRTVVLLN